MKKLVLCQKRRFPLFVSFIFVLFFSNIAFSQQQTIGSFPYMDGGFEGQTANTVLATMSSTLPTSVWSVQSTTTVTTRDILSGSARSGDKYGNFITNAPTQRIQTPTGPLNPTTSTYPAPTPGQPYTIQFYYKSASDPGANVNNAAIYNNTAGGATDRVYITTTAGTFTANNWIKVSGSGTTGVGTVDAKNYACWRPSGILAAAVSIDDFVVYAGPVDSQSPDPSLSGLASNTTATTTTLNWTAPVNGVDGGGYMIVRYTTLPNADNDPNINGIYSVGNFITNGTGALSGKVVYVGTANTFSDNLLTSGNTYYYKIYTVDKAFNYSAEYQINVTTLSAPASPIASAATTVNSSGFTANWNAISNATSYNFYLYEANTVQNIVGWTFPVSWTAASGVTPTADISNANNTTKVITQSAGTVTAGEGSGGPGSVAIQAASWYQAVNKYWEIQANTIGYRNIKVSSKLYSTAPRDFKLQYKIGAGGTYADVPNGTIVCSTDWTSGSLNNLVLPSECENITNLYLRWINYTLIDYTTGIALMGGTVRLDDILVTGSLYQAVAGYPINVPSNSTTISGLNTGSTYYYEVNASNGSANSLNSNQITAYTKTTQSSADFRSTASGNFSNSAIWEWNDGTGVWTAASQAPTSTNNILISNGHEVSMTADFSLGSNKTITVNGAINLAGKVISGSGTFILSSGATIKLGDIESLTTALTTTGALYNSGANYIFNGTTIAQNTSMVPSSLIGNMTISNPIGVTLSQSLKVYLTSTLLVTSTGKLLFGDGTTLSAILSGNGNFTAQSGSTLVITSSDGICTDTTAGTIRNSGIRTFNTGVNYNFTKNDLASPVNSKMGTAFTIISPATSPEISSINNLTVNNAMNVIVPANIIVDGALTFVTGKIVTGSNTITLGVSGSIIGAGTGWVVGNLSKQTASGSSPSFLYALGDLTNYIPLNLTFTGSNTASSTGSILASTSSGDHVSIATSGIDSAKSVNRTWSLTNNGISGFGSYSAAFTYPSSENDISTIPTNYVVRKYENSTWETTTASVTATNTSTASNNITGFGNFAIGEITGLPTFSSQPSNTTICAGSNTSFIANTAATTLPTSIKWQRSVDGNSWVDISANLDSGTTYSGYTSETLQLTGSNNAINTFQYKSIYSSINGNVSSNIATITVITTASPIVNSQSFCNAATVADLSTTGLGTIKWYSDNNTNTALGSTDSLNSATYYVSQILNNCESSRTSVSVVINPTPSSPIASAQTLCNSANIASLTATGTGLQWYSGATGGTALTNSDTLTSTTYYVSQTINACESTRTSVLVTVNNSSTPIVSASQYFCVSGTVAGLAATGTAIKWYTNASGGIALATSTALTSATYYVTQTINACESNRTPVTVSVTATPTAPSASSQTFCNSGTVGSLTANGTGLNWYTASLGGIALASSSALSTGTYFVSQTINTCESARTSVSVTVINASTSAPAASSQTFCNSGIISNLTATGSVLNWYSNQFGGIALTPSTNLSTGTYYVSQTQNSCESNRTAVSVTVNIPPAPTASAQAFCNSGTVAELTATGTSLNWYNSANGGTALSSSTALVSGTYFVSQTLNSCESYRTSVSVTINTVPLAPTSSAQSFCNTGTIAGLIATGTGLQWYSSASGGTVLGSSTALTSGNYFVSQTVNACESSRTSVSITLNISNAPTATSQTFCNSGTVAQLTATGTALNWYSSLNGVTALPTSTALFSGTYFVSQTLNACESTRTSVVVSIITTSAPSALGQTFCNSGTVAELTASGTGLNWYSSLNGVTALPTSTALTTGTYFVTQTVNACESNNRTSVAVTLNITTPPTSNAQTFCNLGTVSGLTATGTALNWYSNLTGGTALAPSTVLTSGTYYVSQTLNACQSNRTSVQVTVNITPAPSASAQSFCYSGTVAGLVANGTALNWYINASTQTVLASTTALISGTYYVTQTLNACQSTRTSVVVTINSTAMPTATSQTFCNSGTVAQLTAVGSGLQWYSSATGGTALATTTALASGTYYVSQTLNSCESINRKSVAVTLNITNAPVAVDQNFCNSGTVAGLSATGTALKWYSVSTGGTILTTSTALTSGTYYVSQTINACESSRTAVTVTVNTTNAPIASDQNFCVSGTIADLTATGIGLKWYSSDIGGTALSGSTPLTSGVYYVSQTINTCESSRASFMVTVNSQPTQPTTACYETATFNSATCSWDVTGSQPAQPTTACYESATFNTATCSWNVTGSQPVQPSTACYESATFNTTSCSWNVTGTQPVQPSTACYESATFNTASCSWNVTGSQPVQPSIACYESATFNANTCLWDVSGNPISAPTGATTQSLNSGQTIADLVVVGNNIVWYSSSTEALSNTNPLALTTVLISGNTYYAMQTINGCSSATPLAVVVTINLANADFDLVGLEFYPNPVKDVLHVSFNQKINSVAIYNLIGQLINFNKPNTTSAEINMSALPQGPYILQIESDGKHKAIKIIKK